MYSRLFYAKKRLTNSRIDAIIILGHIVHVSQGGHCYGR